VKATPKSDLYRKLPSVDELVRKPELIALASDEGQAAVIDAARTVVAQLRQQISEGNLADEAGVNLALSGLADRVARQVRQNLRYSLRPVINATGVILHTNLGRAPLSATALEHVREVASTYSNLEYDVEAGERGKRDVHVERLFRKLLTDEVTGGGADKSVRATQETSTIVVNNNAAAVLIALNTLAEGGEVIVSRGELVEIGGSFRIPEVMTKANVILREVGTTNRTRIADYERAIGERTRLLLRVHRSNFQITGFTEQPAIPELVALARQRNLPLVEDLGSGALIDLRTAGITGEPDVVASLRAGVDLVTYSGDKLLGGPQAGVLSGRRDLVARIRANPLFRALRVDKLTYAALEATLLAYVRGDYDCVPALRMMHLPKEAIRQRAQALAARVNSSGLETELMDGESVMGGGAAPSSVLPTALLAVTCDELSTDELASRLRRYDVPIVARVEEGRVLLDLRTVFPEQDGMIADALNRISAEKSPGS
jgi:L-seryl-tRNA(Ser) seleniumtransferase